MQQGILAIWNDIKAGHEAEFEGWFQGEHLIERLAVPGFQFGRRHEAISGASDYFAFYVVKTPAVLRSEAYLERLDHPTPMTKRIMTDVFRNMSRTVCYRTVRYSPFRGAYAVTVRFNDAPDIRALSARAEELSRDAKIASCEIWTAVDAAGQKVSQEEKLRGGDKKIKACLMADTLRQDEARKLGDRLAKEFPGTELGVFRVLCQLGNGGVV